MPQTLTPEWTQMLGANALEAHAQWLDTVGNLTLSGYNPDLGNRPFGDKQRLLGQSNFALSKGLQDFDKWNEVMIQMRGQEMADRAAAIWRGNS